jgi:hypothetical protein
MIGRGKIRIESSLVRNATRVAVYLPKKQKHKWFCLTQIMQMFLSLIMNNL